MGKIIKPCGGGLVTSKLLVPSSTTNLRIDQSHPIAVGLTSAFLPGLNRGYDHFGAFRTLDWFDNGAAAASGGTLVSTIEGPAMGCSIANRRSLSSVAGIVPASVRAWTTEASFYIRFFQITTSAAANALMFVDDGSNPAMGLSAGGGNSATYNFFWQGFGASTVGTAVATNKVHGALVSYKVGGLTSQMWMDGLAYSTTTTAVTNPALNASLAAIGIGQNTDVRILAIYTWRRALSQQEAVLLEGDPYCVFQAPANNLWYSAAYPTQFPAADDTQPRFARWTRTERATALAATTQPTGPFPTVQVTQTPSDFFPMVPIQPMPLARNYGAALASTTEAVSPLEFRTPTPGTYLELLITDDRPMRADVIGIALKATTSPIWPQAPPAAAQTPAFQFDMLIQQDNPVRANYQPVLAATTLPVLPVFIPPVGVTPTPSFWVQNPDSTLPDWW